MSNDIQTVLGVDAMTDRLGNNPWLSTAVAWEVCASIHRQFALGKDGVIVRTLLQGSRTTHCL